MVASTSTPCTAGELFYDEDTIVCEKNTFICIVGATAVRSSRSSSSVPPAMRLAGERRMQGGKSVAPEAVCVTKFPRVPSLSEVSTTVGCSETDSAGQGQDLASSAGDFESECGSVGSLSETPQPIKIALSDHIALKSRIRLNTKAKAFVSTFQPVCKFRLQVDVVAAAMRAAMAAMGLLAPVRTSAFPGGMVLTATVRDGLHGKDVALSSAKEALLQTVERSASLCVLGYQRNPFATAVDGFSVVLCGVENDGASCWDLLAHGFCRRGCRCQWRHPNFTCKLDFRVAVMAS